jgi:hypothetical protein
MSVTDLPLSSTQHVNLYEIFKLENFIKLQITLLTESEKWHKTWLNICMYSLHEISEGNVKMEFYLISLYFLRASFPDFFPYILSFCFSPLLNFLP